MTPPKEKAIELVDKFAQITDDYHRPSKQCALIVVEEILNNEMNHLRGISEDLHDEYWEQVKIEINKL